MSRIRSGARGPIRWVLAAPIALLCGIACNEPKTPPKPVAPTDGLTLVSPGVEPRQVLRYRVATSSRTSVTLAIDVDLDAAGQGGPLPTMVMETEIACEDVMPDGSMKIRTTIVHVTAKDRPGGVVPAGQMATSELDGMAITGVLSPNGTLKNLNLDLTGKDLPPALAEQLTTLSRSFEQVTMPLPTEPIGVGAQWQHRKTLDQAGMSMVSVTTIKVSSIAGGAVVFSSSSEIRGDDQTITLGGTTIELKNVGGTGSGFGTVDLSRMAMTGEVSGEFHSDMNAQGQDATMKMKIVTRMSPGPPVAAQPAPPADAADAAGHGAQSAP